MKRKIIDATQFIYTNLFLQFSSLAKFFFNRLNRNSTENVVFLIAPTMPGSLGDEAMIVTSITEFSKKFDMVYVICHGSDWSHSIGKYNLTCEFLDVRFLFQAPLGWPQLYRYIERYKPQQISVIGADVMDGFYSPSRSLSRLSILDLASTISKRVELLGFSFNARPDQRCVNYIHKLSKTPIKFFARDRVSHERMLDRNIENILTADIAFLLESKNCEQRISEIKGPYICLNICSVHVLMFGQIYINKIKNFYKSLIQNFQLHDIVLISHDTRKYADNYSDWSLLKEFYDELEPVLQKRVHLMSDNLLAAEAKWLCSQADFCIVGRKHMGVGALGGETPTMFFGYQGKQAGLLASFNIDPKLALIDAEKSVDDWMHQFGLFQENLSQIKDLISEALPSVKQLSMKNFE